MRRMVLGLKPQSMKKRVVNQNTAKISKSPIRDRKFRTSLKVLVQVLKPKVDLNMLFIMKFR